MSKQTNPGGFNPIKVNPEKVNPVEFRQEKVEPLKLDENKHEETPAPGSSKGAPPPAYTETATEPPQPRRPSPSPSLRKSPVVLSLETQPPPTPGPLPGPSTSNRLKPSTSVSTLLDGPVNNTPNRILAPSRSNPALSVLSFEPPRPEPNRFQTTSASTPSINVPDLRPGPGRAPIPSSLLNNIPTQPPPKVKKRGLFCGIFGFGGSKPKEPPRPAKRLSKPMPTRPTSTVFANPTARPSTSNFTTRPASIVASNSMEPTLGVPQSPVMRPQSVLSQSSMGPSLISLNGQRKRAVLTKKQPNTRPTKHAYHSSTSTRPGRPTPHQNLGHARYNSYPQTPTLHGRPSFASFTMDHNPDPNYTTYASPSDIYDNSHRGYSEFGRTTAPAFPTPTNGQTYSPIRHPYSPNHTQSVTTAEYIPYPGTGDYYGTGRHTGAHDSGYQPLATIPGYALCTVCKTQLRYIDPITGETSPYCTDACQAAARATSSQTQQATCSYPGCKYPAVVYPADHFWNYCGESHEHYARKGCVSCRQADKNGTQLCTACDATFKQKAPVIIPIPKDHDTFWRVSDKFTESWAHPTQCPVVLAVFKVALAQDNLDTYTWYRDTLEYYGQFAAQGKRNGNERTLWHGTRRSCNLGEAGQTTLCNTPRCSLCSIIRGPFDIGKFATNTPAGRFGAGIYTSTKTSKANDYSSNDRGVATECKALLLSNVAAGQECVTHYDDTTLTAPPQGYDSVYGEAGGNLNYDELVVYTSDAIRPTWLVMYNRG